MQLKSRSQRRNRLRAGRKGEKMAHIPDMDRSVFKEANQTMLDNFTNEELLTIRKIAEDLKTILRTALKRHKEKIG